MTPSDSLLQEPGIAVDIEDGASELGSIPKYVRLANDFRRRLKAGELVPGQQLPSFNVMQAEHGVAQATLVQMYSLLERDGLIIRTKGRGTFVAEPRPQQASGIVGVLMHEASHQNPYYAATLQGIQGAAHNYGLSILLITDPGVLADAKIDGLITYYISEEHIGQLPPGLSRISLILPRKDMGSVTADDYEGSRQATEHLVSLGHRRISFLTIGCQKNSDMTSLKRFAAYRDVLEAHGIEASSQWAHPLYGPWTPRHENDLRKNGYMKMVEWLQEGWRDLGCTAIMAQNDEVAVGIIEALEEVGLRVPHDVSVVGFDGTVMADFFRPRLTTVVVPLQEIGRTGVDQLGRMIRHPLNGVEDAEGGHVHIVLPAQLRIGDSTASPREGAVA